MHYDIIGDIHGHADELATNKEHEAFLIIEELLKGKETKLENGLSFKDKDGTERFECRVKWWQPLNQRNTYGDIMMVCPAEIKDLAISQNNHYYYPQDKPVFFGHYWLPGKPKLENKKAICLDYSVAKGGILTGFRTEFLNDNNPKNGFVF